MKNAIYLKKSKVCWDSEELESPESGKEKDLESVMESHPFVKWMGLRGIKDIYQRKSNTERKIKVKIKNFPLREEIY